MNWDDVRIFLALVEHGRLAAAARALQVNHATISRRLAAIEARFGRPLFERERSGLRLTALGEAVEAEARAMERAALSVARLADTGPDLGGSVRITTARAMAIGYLAGRLAGLTGQHPELEVGLIADTRILSLAQREADIAVRLGRPDDADLVGSHVGDIGYGFYAAPAVKSAFEAGAPVAHIGAELDSDGAEARWRAARFPDHRFVLRAHSQLAQRAAAQGGVGIALLPHYLATTGLETVDLGAVPPARPIWLMTRRDLAKVPRFRVTLDYLARLYRADRALFIGG